MFNPIVVIVGCTTVGKTSLAYALADALASPVVICGDQWQLVRGFPVCKATHDAWVQQRRFPRIGTFLYGQLPETSDRTLLAEEYEDLLLPLLGWYRDRCVVIDSLSVAFLPVLKAITDRPVVVIGCLPPKRHAWLIAKRALNLALNGALLELYRGMKTWGADCWYFRNSFIAQQFLLRMAGRRSWLTLLGDLVRIAMTGEATGGKHRRLLASGCVTLWVDASHKKRAIRQALSVVWERIPKATLSQATMAL